MPIAKQEKGLVCTTCGNDQLFVEYASEQINQVDGYQNHLHLVESLVEEYRCHFCGATVTPRASRIA